MPNMISPYRIYPSWFTRNGYSRADGPMNELAAGSAKRMGCTVQKIEIVGYGEDVRGPYTDFNVTYSSSSMRAEAK